MFNFIIEALECFIVMDTPCIFLEIVKLLTGVR
jgi:hypothetical protein